MEPISQTIATGFVVGVIVGIIDEINRKLFAVIWILAVIWTIFSFFIQGPSDYASGLNWGVWNWIAMIISVSISVMVGKFGFRNVKDAFAKKGGTDEI